MDDRNVIRQRVSEADAVIERYDRLAREELGDVLPPMDPSTEAVAATSTAGITVSAEWLAAMFEHIDRATQEREVEEKK